MEALALRLFPNASAESVAEFETLASVPLFCGVGLLMSVSVLLLDKHFQASGSGASDRHGRTSDARNCDPDCCAVVLSTVARGQTHFRPHPELNGCRRSA